MSPSGWTGSTVSPDLRITGAYRGSWEDDSTFAMDYHVVDYTERGTVRLRFRDDGLTAWFHDYIGGDYHELTATLEKE